MRNNKKFLFLCLMVCVFFLFIVFSFVRAESFSGAGYPAVDKTNGYWHFYFYANKWQAFSVPVTEGLSYDFINSYCPGSLVNIYGMHDGGGYYLLGNGSKLEPGRGYWIKFNSDCPLNFTGNDYYYSPKTLELGTTYFIGMEAKSTVVNNKKGTCNNLELLNLDSQGNYVVDPTGLMVNGWAYWIKNKGSQNCTFASALTNSTSYHLHAADNMGQPIIVPPSSWVQGKTAKDLAEYIPGSTTVTKWDKSAGGWVSSYSPGLPMPNFNLESGVGYAIGVSEDTVVYFSGSQSQDLIINFPRTSQTIDQYQFTIPENWVGKTADDLITQIKNANDIFYYDVVGQGTIGHVEGLPFNNFTLEAGRSYIVQITDNTSFDPKAIHHLQYTWEDGTTAPYYAYCDQATDCVSSSEVCYDSGSRPFANHRYVCKENKWYLCQYKEHLGKEVFDYVCVGDASRADWELKGSSSIKPENQYSCTDGYDNDGDQLIDNQDPDCVTGQLHDFVVQDITHYFSPQVGNKMSLYIKFNDFYKSSVNLIDYDFKIDAPGAVIGPSILGSGNNSEIWRTIMYNEAGSHSLIVTVDPDNKIKETNESNNSKSYTIEVEDTPLGPHIPNVYVTDITHNSAKVVFTTDVITKGEVWYKSASEQDYDHVIKDDNFSQEHAITLDNLESNKLYYYFVSAVNVDNYSNSTTRDQFTTKGVQPIFSISEGSNNPASAIYSGNTAGVTIGNINLSAGNEDVKIEGLNFNATGFNYGNLDLINKVYLYDGAVQLGVGIVTSTANVGISLMQSPLTIPANTTKTVSLKADLSQIGPADSYTAKSGEGIRLFLNADDIIVRGASGTLYGNDIKNGDYSTNRIYLFKSFPVVSASNSINNITGNGSYDLFKFSIAVNSTGPVAWHKLTFNIDTVGEPTLSGLALYEGSTLVSTADYAGNNQVSFYANQSTADHIEIPAGTVKQYSLKGDITDYNSTIQTAVNVKMIGDSGENVLEPDTTYAIDHNFDSNFIWSDLNYGNTTSTASTTKQWVNGKLVKGLAVTNAGDGGGDDGGGGNNDNENEQKEIYDNKLAKRLAGRILLAVRDKGRVYYVSTENYKKYEVTFGNLMGLFEDLALGITAENLNKIPINPSTMNDKMDSDQDGFNDKQEAESGHNPFGPGRLGPYNYQLANRLQGKILLVVDQGGQIWYVDETGKRWQVTWSNVMNLFMSLALGITNEDLAQIEDGY